MTTPTPNAPVPEQLSPAAQAVLTAFAKASDGEYIDGEWQQDDVGQLAAALHAAADQVVPVNGSRKNNEIRAELLAIATEIDRAESVYSKTLFWHY